VKAGATSGHVIATRTRKTRGNAWMPNVVVLRLDGTKAGKLLVLAGWSIATDEAAESGDLVSVPAWPKTRLRAMLASITREWFESHGKSWKLVIV
jgi:hypothetical protein